jgi:hypothetical protein
MISGRKDIRSPLSQAATRKDDAPGGWSAAAEEVRDRLGNLANAPSVHGFARTRISLDFRLHPDSPLANCYPERGLVFAPKAQRPPQSKDPYPQFAAGVGN